jgi:hypothetical protein
MNTGQRTWSATSAIVTMLWTAWMASSVTSS